MKIPYFEDNWKDAPRFDKKTVKRKNILVILKHSDREEFCLLVWKKFWWNSLIVWWVDEWEWYIEAAKREVIEETWYNDFWECSLLDLEFNTSFYASHKDINRYSIEKYVFIQLNSMQNIWVDEKETQNHNFLWIAKNEVADFLNLDNNMYAWRLFSTWKEEDIEYLEELKSFKWYK